MAKYPCIAVVERVLSFCTTHSVKHYEQFVEDYTDYSSVLQGNKYRHGKQYCCSVREINSNHFVYDTLTGIVLKVLATSGSIKLWNYT